jgi:hypothetical protein
MAKSLVSAKGAEFLWLTLDEFLGRVSAPAPAPAGGSVGPLALAAAPCVKAARLSARHSPDADELATLAGGLRARRRCATLTLSSTATG